MGDQEGGWVLSALDEAMLGAEQREAGLAGHLTFKLCIIIINRVSVVM